LSHLKYTALTPELYHYTLEVSSQESEALRHIREQNDKHPQIRMQIAQDQAQFLQFLIRTVHAKRILEIGTFLGYSAAAMAEALPEHGQVVTCDMDKHASLIAQQHWDNCGLTNKIEFKLGPALETMQSLVDNNELFDFIFIDADKRNYPHYYHLAKKLLFPEGIIAIDNVFYHGEVCQKEPSKNGHYIDVFNRLLLEDKEVYITMVPIADGLSLVRKK
jgi:predicted O-methyltransferase YrrM